MVSGNPLSSRFLQSLKISFSACSSQSEMCNDNVDVADHWHLKEVAYYNFPRGKWSFLIISMLRWWKEVSWWWHRPARATFSNDIMKKNESHSWKRTVLNDWKIEFLKVILDVNIIVDRRTCSYYSKQKFGINFYLTIKMHSFSLIEIASLVF